MGSHGPASEPQWAVGPSANRELALLCWSRATERLVALGADTRGAIVHHDQDSVYTSYDWLEAILLQSGARVSYSENGAKDNPWIESLWGRFKAENSSLIREAPSLPKLTDIIDTCFNYYNRERRHSAIEYQPPLVYLHHRLNRGDIPCRLSAN